MPPKAKKPQSNPKNIIKRTTLNSRIRGITEGILPTRARRAPTSHTLSNSQKTMATGPDYTTTTAVSLPTSIELSVSTPTSPSPTTITSQASVDESLSTGTRPKTSRPTQVATSAEDVLNFWNSLPEYMKTMCLQSSTTPSEPPAPPPSSYMPYVPQPHQANAGFSQNYRVSTSLSETIGRALPATTAQPSVPLPLSNPLYSNYQPQVVATVAPNLDSLPAYADDAAESWENFIERWEILLAPYKYNNEQMALTLPAKLIGAAWQAYRSVVKSYPHSYSDYQSLKEYLSQVFKKNKPLQARNLWSLTQGKRTVNEFYSEVVSVGRSVFPSMSEEHRDKVLANAFIAGLKENHQRDVLMKGELTLQHSTGSTRSKEERGNRQSLSTE